MIAISSDDIIVKTRCGDRTDDDRFLADVEMTEAANLLRLILLTGAFFKAPDQQHQREHLDFVALLRPLHAGLRGARHHRSRARTFGTTSEVHASYKKESEKEIAQERITKKYPSRR